MSRRRLLRLLSATTLTLAAAAGLSSADAAPAGAWQTRSQLVWDADAGALVRKAYRAWNASPERDLEFEWDGPASGNGPIEGEGRLVWRERGAPAYDPAAVYSDYRGTVRNGRPDGEGRLRLRDGLVYDGDWRDGAMDGEGVIRFANGESFSGRFADGAPEGDGRLTTPDGRVWHSVWRNGTEVERTPAEGALRLAQADGVAVNVYMDGRLNDDFRAAKDEDGFEHFTYVADDTSGVLRIALDGGLMDHWKGDAPILATLRQGWSNLFESPVQFGPVFVVVDIANEGNQTAEVVGAWLDIAESMTDLQPYLDAWGPADGCNARLDPQFSLQNHGWGGVENARLTYAFGNEQEAVGDIYVADIGDFDLYTNVSLLDGIEARGLDVGRLQNDDFQCSSEAEYPACLARWQDSELLAPLNGALFSNDYAQLLTRMWGILEYTWTDAKGVQQQRKSSVIVDFPVLDVSFGPECGAGGPVDRSYPTAKLPLDVENQRIPINYTTSIAPREQQRFGLNFVADKASRHQFRFVVELADGRTIASPDIDLSYFIPRTEPLN